jgi:membrane-associated phospholipid phosphatase
MNNEIAMNAAPSGPPGLYLWGLELVRAVQALENPILTGLVKGFTALGTELFYIPALLFSVWCEDEKRGFRLGLLDLFSAWTNIFFKALFQQPRPYNLDPSVGRAFEPSYGLPSGHAQGSLVFWAPLGFGIGREGAARGGGGQRLFRGLVVFIILGMAFTRLYLGVHFPTDILGGWVWGGVLLTIYGLLGKRAAAFLEARGPRIQLIAAAALVLCMNALFPGDKSLGGLLLGFAGGYVLMRRNFSFAAGAAVRGKRPGFLILAPRYILGLAGAGLVYLGLRLLFPGEGSLFAAYPVWGEFSPYHDLGRFIRYGLVGLWASAGAPRFFLRLGLAGGPPEAGA